MSFGHDYQKKKKNCLLDSKVGLDRIFFGAQPYVIKIPFDITFDILNLTLKSLETAFDIV